MTRCRRPVSSVDAVIVGEVFVDRYGLICVGGDEGDFDVVGVDSNTESWGTTCS